MRFAAIDTETSGLPFHPAADISLQPRIIEFAGIITDGAEILNRLEFICNPGVAIEPIITQITGLTNADLRDKPDFSTFIGAIAAFFSEADASISHNHSFETAMLRFDMERRGERLETLQMPKLAICTVEQTYHQYGKRVKLEDLYNEHCGEYKQEHRAMSDVLRLHELCQTLGIYAAFTQGEAA